MVFLNNFKSVILKSLEYSLFFTKIVLHSTNFFVIYFVSFIFWFFGIFFGPSTLFMLSTLNTFFLKAFSILHGIFGSIAVIGDYTFHFFSKIVFNGLMFLALFKLLSLCIFV